MVARGPSATNGGSMKLSLSSLVSVPPAAGVPPEVEMTATHHLVPPVSSPPPSVQKTSAVIDLAVKGFRKVMGTQGLDQDGLGVLSLTSDLWLLRWGIPKTLAVLQQPDNAKTQLLPAAQAVREHEGDVRAHSDALEG